MPRAKGQPLLASFFAKLAEALIDFEIEDVEGKLTCSKKKQNIESVYNAGALALEETTSLKKSKTNNSKQGLCSVYWAHTVTVCSLCTSLLQTKQIWMCRVNKNPNCWKQHIHKFH